jgi:carboxymethylenebutenolidase
LATISWGFGDSWALSAATVETVDATVVYYGRVNHPTGEMRHLKIPIMGHFAIHDTWINHDMVTLFELGMLKTQKRSISHWYEAGHAFANPTDIR